MKESAKTVANFIIGSGVMTVVGGAVAALCPVVGAPLLTKALVSVGSLALSMYASDKVTDWSDKKIDEVVETLNDVDSGKVEVVDNVVG